MITTLSCNSAGPPSGTNRSRTYLLACGKVVLGDETVSYAQVYGTALSDISSAKRDNAALLLTLIGPTIVGAVEISQPIILRHVAHSLVSCYRRRSGADLEQSNILFAFGIHLGKRVLGQVLGGIRLRSAIIVEILEVIWLPSSQT
jgi:hypothetical protein